MKHPIQSAGQIPGLKDTLIAFLTELRDVQNDATEKNIASIDIGEEITVTVELLAKGGLNAIPRISVAKNGEQVKRDISPAIVETTVAGEELSEESAEPTTVKDSATKKHSQRTKNGTNGGDTVRTDQTIEEG